MLSDFLGVFFFCSKIADFLHTCLFSCGKHCPVFFCCFSFPEIMGQKLCLASSSCCLLFKTKEKQNQLPVSSLFRDYYFSNTRFKKKGFYSCQKESQVRHYSKQHQPAACRSISLCACCGRQLNISGGKKHHSFDINFTD